jgi:hypothetical protein
MNGEPTRLVDDSTLREELRERLTREAATPPYKYDFEKGLERLRAAIAAESQGAEEQGTAAPPSAKASAGE